MAFLSVEYERREELISVVERKIWHPPQEQKLTQWIKIWDIPVHLWDHITFELIAKQWGKLSAIDDGTLRAVRMDWAKIEVSPVGRMVEEGFYFKAEPSSVSLVIIDLVEETVTSSGNRQKLWVTASSEPDCFVEPSPREQSVQSIQVSEGPIFLFKDPCNICEESLIKREHHKLSTTRQLYKFQKELISCSRIPAISVRSP
ncbi:hypothetical protein H6P81_017437 [Aristolochia fimbriata]|uniref:DUF4283 domain-containing protein n=1 Tax=Aristolochia fimbriata TaxID=158543 RepID=A0AAV7DYZ9_ARIFI|nr:hypothetical protein H6P81_017437 [Aristolochia fimbriata]